MRREALVCHPDTRSNAVREVSVTVSSLNRDTLSLSFCLEGDLARIRVPPRMTPRRADGLWRHTCFEAFIAAGDGPTYFELNFAPSGEWAAYAFRSYREGAAFERDLDPRIAVSLAEDRLQLDAWVPLALLSPVPGRRLRLGLSAVVEEEGEWSTYWALKHPPGPPDFHHPDAFALQLDV
ncbi:MAG TPA: DOMON-like domain-containing protein [Burkholderiales bacterium]|nr:DOMON-like domain-containing protein [Burkholderiales bacterium]